MDSRYFGTTVNERLYLGRVIDEFYQAISEKNYYLAKEILKKVDLADESIEPILKANGLSPNEKENL